MSKSAFIRSRSVLASAVTEAQISESYGRLPLQFEVNQDAFDVTR